MTAEEKEKIVRQAIEQMRAQLIELRNFVEYLLMELDTMEEALQRR